MRLSIRISLCVGILATSVVSGVVSAETGAISRLVFITDTRVVAVGELSEALSVQTQNSAGEPEKVEETADISFQSSSPTGQFLGASGSPVSTVMSKGTANRTFYYRDQTEGVHTLSVRVTTRSGTYSWEATQIVYVGNSSGGNDSLPPSSSSVLKQEVLSHDAQVELSGSLKISSIDIGRERSVTPHVPLSFTASGAPSRGHFVWSFGDGFSKRGRTVYHTYMSPGTYVVILNAYGQNFDEIARTTVTVTEAQVKIVSDSSGLFMENSGSKELNVGGWQVSSSALSYLFPRDTIILPGSRIFLTPLLGQTVDPGATLTVRYPNGAIALLYSPRIVRTLSQASPVSDPIPPRSSTQQPVTSAAAASPSFPISTNTLSLPTSTEVIVVTKERTSWWGRLWGRLFSRTPPSRAIMEEY